MNIIFTVCNRTNLTNALALGSSVMQFPGYTFYLCWADTGTVPNLPENIKLLRITELNIPDWEQMSRRYYDFELLPACRPWFAKHLIRTHQELQALIFFAPTVYLYSSIDHLVGQNYDLQLTPNISRPLKKSTILDDKRILNIGMFHSGSWILQKSTASLEFLDWWAERTQDRAKFDLCNGMCLDQLWLNYAFVRVKKLFQLSQSGWHYGLHSVLNQKLELKNGKYSVDGNTLISIDFAGLDSFDPIWSDHKRLLHQNANFKKLYLEYQKSLGTFKTFKPLETTPGYGMIPEIKNHRLMRKEISAKLKSLVRVIDLFKF